MDHLQQKKKWKRRTRKVMGVRRRLRASSDRPRLCVYRSSKHISVQVIDDLAMSTLAAVSSQDPILKDELTGKTKTEKAQIVGRVIAERAIAAGITDVKFDRGWCLYHGRVRALGDAAREGGLKF
ncbi:MAG: 50S ribosomal protein L18 [Planctomycetes bacterium]|jgi:large subunit ribosomal protein L18|nr:50S ribosomal protein L18 [Planctomycetota bacterium]MBT4028275.1 50S ribosomal protein L18 [Planctomycetota bacterium]MBT4560932.1 50S ribosomal protein L18 [Planctomycetota bacterium]MBT5101307.1 50S ribosomal protein L18 [Planctomycetota bacterium]MBT5119619.1 50S ribosomal protein L18 [Planctomycetota bacterium]